MSAASSTVNRHKESMEFFYVMNNLNLLSSIQAQTSLYTSKDRNSIKLLSKGFFGVRRSINLSIFQRTFTEAFRILEISRRSEESKQITNVIEKAIIGLDVVSKTYEKKNKNLCRDFYGMYFEFRRKYQSLPPPPPLPGMPLRETIARVSQRVNYPEIELAKKTLQSELAEHISKLGLATQKSVEKYEDQLLKKKLNQRKYFNFPFLNSPLYQNLAPKISEAAMVQIVPKYVFKRTTDTSPYISDGSKLLKRSDSSRFDKAPAPKFVELRRAASELIDPRFLEMIQKRRKGMSGDRSPPI